MDYVKKCKAVWSSATSDTERFAALILIVKLAKESDLSSFHCKEIFKEIGFVFVSRLLKTEEVPQGCSPAIYQSLALSVLSCFSCDEEIAESNEMCSLTEEFKNILNAKLFSTGEESLIVDTLECIYGISRSEKGRLHIQRNNVVLCLVDLYVNDTCGKAKSLQILQVMTFYLKSRTWENHSSKFNDLFSKMCKEFSDGFSVEMCQAILNILLDHPLCKIQGDEIWASEIKVTLTKVLRCKVIKELRDLAIKLSSLMVEKCGTFWLEDNTDSSKIFFVVLIQVVCVEVRVVFEGRTVEDILKDTFVLSACFSTLEIVVTHMIRGTLWLCVRDYSTELIASVRAAYKVIIEFLNMVSTLWNSASDAAELPLKELTYASVRALCAWLAGETGTLEESAREVFPFVLSLCNECLLTIQCEIPHTSHVDLMRFFISPLCYLTLNDATCTILLEHGLPGLLFRYMNYQWSLYQQFQSSDIEILFSTMCGLIVNIVVMDSRFVSESEEFLSFIKFLFKAVSFLPDDFPNLNLKADFCAVGLLVTKVCYKGIDVCDNSFQRFLSFSMKFLCGAHSIGHENHRAVLVLVKEYHHVWSDIMELWFLGMNTLSTLLPVQPRIASFLMESGWPQHIIASFSKVESIEETTKCAYQTLLCALVRVSSDVIPALNHCGAITVCKKHELTEFESLLQQ